MTKVIMNGCNGKMGQTITEICKADADIKIVAGIDLYDGIDNDYPVFSSIDKCDVDADVVIDFSNAKAVDGVLDYCVDKQVPVVLCTTGLSDEQLAKVEECYKKVAVLKSANMSLGINTLMALLKKAAQVFAPAGFDMEIVEKHQSLMHLQVLRLRLLIPSTRLWITSITMFTTAASAERSVILRKLVFLLSEEEASSVSTRYFSVDRMR